MEVCALNNDSPPALGKHLSTSCLHEDDSLKMSVPQLCLTLCDPIAHQAPLSVEFSRQELLEWESYSLLQGIFPTQGLNLVLLHWQAAEPPRNQKEPPRSRIM